MAFLKKLFRKKALSADEAAFSFGAALGNVLEGAWEIDADGNAKIETGEILGFVSIFVSEALKNFSTVKDALAAIRTGSGRDQFKAGFADGFDLEDDAKEAVVEGWLDIIDSVLDQVEATKAAFAK